MTAPHRAWRPATPFRPSWWLPGAHLPTIWGKKGRKQRLVHDRTERVTTPDGDHVTLARMGTARPGVSHLLVLHGLEGTVRANYAHGLLEKAGALGWSGDLLLFRSCDGELNSARRLYHSGETTDLDFIVRRLAAESPDSPIVVCGVSLGGNVLLKWLADPVCAAHQIVRRAAAVSVPYDLAAGSRFLERGVSRLYVHHFLSSLKPKAVAKEVQYPGSINVARALASRTFWEFDDAVTAPLHGFTSAAEYYAKSSSIAVLDKVQVPTLLLNAFDDPFIPRDVLERVLSIAADTRTLTAHFTTRGGHVGWVQGGPLSTTYYMEHAVIDFLCISTQKL